MFEFKMALRYITAQKRHSLLTICSIASALALITMLFTCFFTAFGCAADIAYAEKPYHLQISKLTADETQIVRDYVGDKADITAIEDDDGLLTLRIYFTEYIDDSMFKDPGYLQELTKLLKDSGANAEYDSNASLIELDLIDVDSRANFAVYFAVFYIFANFFIIMLRLIIDTAFEISSKERERQFGVLQSVGATPAQIVKAITAEGLILSAVGIPVGIPAGIALGYGAYRAVVATGFLFTPRQLEYVRFHVSPLFILISAVTGLAWVLLSAYGTGMRVIKMSPTEAIRSGSGTVRKVRRFSLFGTMFGWKGKMASRNNFRQPKRFAITVLTLTLSMTLFAGTTALDSISEMVIFAVSDTEPSPADLVLEYSAPTTEYDYRDSVERLENSLCFENVFCEYSRVNFVKDSSGIPVATIIVSYMNAYAYSRYFKGDPPMSYEELSESGGHMLALPEEGYKYSGEVGEMQSSRRAYFETFRYETLTPEEYAALSEEEKSECYMRGDNTTYTKPTEITAELDITAEGASPVVAEEMSNYGFTPVFIIGTLDTFDKMCDEYYGKPNYFLSIYCDLAGDEHFDEAMDTIKADPCLTVAYDFYSEERQREAVKAAVHIAVAFITAGIALIAIVNMVNIISTGILNRRGELASMQCLGMTRGQLYGMTAVECLQYAVTAGVLSTALAALIVWATKQMILSVFSVEDMISFDISYADVIGRVWISALVAFAAALVASAVPLISMRKKSLVDMIRKAD